jgi:hypothetical protein
MRGLSGLIVTPMWREFMDIALEKREQEFFEQPLIELAGKKPIIRGEYIDASIIQQQLASSGTSTVSMSDITGNIHNILHFVDRNNPNGPYPSNPAADPQYANWEFAVQEWKNTTYGALLPTTATTTNSTETTEDSAPSTGTGLVF